MIQIKLMVGSVTFSSMGPMRGKYVFLMTKCYIYMYIFSTFSFIVLEHVASFYLNNCSYWLGKYPDSNKNRVRCVKCPNIGP